MLQNGNTLVYPGDLWHMHLKLKPHEGQSGRQLSGLDQPNKSCIGSSFVYNTSLYLYNQTITRLTDHFSFKLKYNTDNRNRLVSIGETQA